MSELLENIASKFPATSANPTAMGGVGDLLKAGTGGAGLLSNIMTGIKSSEISGDMQKQMKLLMSYLANPAALATKANSMTAPLNAGLVQNVGNATQAQLAQRGLSSSPAQAGAIMSQSLAPFEQQNQQDAMRAVMQLLGLPIQAGAAAKAALPGQANLGALWNLFQPQKMPQPGVVNNAPSTLPNLSDTGAGWPGSFLGPTPSPEGGVPFNFGYNSPSADQSGFNVTTAGTGE